MDQARADAVLLRWIWARSAEMGGVRWLLRSMCFCAVHKSEWLCFCAVHEEMEIWPHIVIHIYTDKQTQMDGPVGTGGWGDAGGGLQEVAVTEKVGRRSRVRAFRFHF